MPQPEPVQVAFRVFATDWGLRGHGSRQIDWLVDGKLLHRDNVLFVIDQPISKEYYKALSAKYRVYDASYYGLRWLEKISYADEERWTHFLTHWRPTHWVSYNDFSPRHKFRNRILRDTGVQTWLYSHSINLPPEGYGPWKDLDYDHLVLWNEMDAKHFEGGQKHILGPLFSSQVPQTVVAVFDSTWAHYPTGIREKFFVDLFAFLDRHPGMIMLYKPKWKTEPIVRPRFYTLPEWLDPALVIGCAHFSISLYGASTNVEAQDAGKIGFWYDPFGTTFDLDTVTARYINPPLKETAAQRFRELLVK